MRVLLIFYIKFTYYNHNMFIMTIVRFLLMLSAVVAVPTVQKLYLCNDETGFCERQPHGSLEGSPQDLCLLTCKGTIWPAPLDVKITHETEAFCKVSFTGFPRNEIESAAADNFLSSLHLVGTCPYPEKTLEVFFEANVSPLWCELISSYLVSLILHPLLPASSQW